MLTGTASTGVILLREIDPRFETAACKNLIFQALWTVLMGFPLLLMMGFVDRSMGWLMGVLGVLTLMFIGFFIWIRLAIKKINAEAESVQ